MSQAVRLGIISGLLAGILFLVESQINQEQLQLPNAVMLLIHYSGTAIIMASVYLAVSRTRERELGGLITFKQGLRVGMKATVIMSLLFMIAFFINLNYLEDIRNVFQERHPITKRLVIETPSLLQGSSVWTVVQKSIRFSIPTIMLGFFSAVGSSLVLRKGTGMLNEN